jgi:hypothetical protein
LDAFKAGSSSEVSAVSSTIDSSQVRPMRFDGEFPYFASISVCAFTLTKKSSRKY